MSEVEPPSAVPATTAAHGHHRRRARLWGAVSELGITLITLGLVVLLFAGYQLWGTGVAEARSQRRLKRDFLAATAKPAASTTTVPPSSSTSSPTSTTAPATTTTTLNDPAAVQPSVTLPAAGAVIGEGHVVGLIQIPKIGLDQAFVQGVNVPDLQLGPGHYPGTPYPGEAGNAAIAGHRTTYGAPFYRLNELKAGDQIITKTRAGRFLYLVSQIKVVKPTETDVLNPTPDNRLTLTTCNPRYNATQRLVVIAALQVPAAPAQPQIVTPPPPASSKASGDQVVVASTAAPARVASPALNGESGAWPAAIAWGLAFVVLWVLTRLAIRHWRDWRRWSALGAGVPLCLAALWPLFENVTRLLPANL